MIDFLTSILVATDGSEDAALAVRVAADLSNRTGSDLHVAYIWRRPTFLGLPLEKAAEGSSYAREEAERLLEAQAEQTRAAGGTVAGAYLREGRPAEVLVELARELSVGLVVVGSRGLGAVKRLIVGSVSEGVVDLAPCPTLIVRGGEGAWPPSRLVVGDDGSEEARRAGELAAGMGKLFGVRALLIRVYPSVPVFKARRIVHLQASGEILKRGERSLEERAAELEGVLGMRPETRVASGDAAAVLQEMAEEGARPALVAVGRRGLGTVRYSTLGGVSANVLRSVAGPVLIVPTPREGLGRAYNDSREEEE